MKELVIIVGSGPSGIAVSACLNNLSIPNIVLEREDCLASLWKKKAYDCLKIHVPKRFAEFPHMPFPAEYPTYVTREQFIDYINNYVSHFNVKPLYNRFVESAVFNKDTKRWCVKVRNTTTSSNSEDQYLEEYVTRFLVVATGESSDEYVPDVEGLESFTGDEVLHSTLYRSGSKYNKKNVLVVGSGNSGMEIALDLSKFGAKTSIVVRSPVHIMNKELMHMGLVLALHLPLNVVDGLITFLSKIIIGDMSKHGIQRPKEGPYFLKDNYGKYPIVDKGTCNKVKSGEIQVLPSITNIMGNIVNFSNGKSYPFDVIVFATGFKRSTNKWLKDDDCLLNEDGVAKLNRRWKGQNGLYCVGLSRQGFFGAAIDAKNIANDIKSLLSN